MQKKLDLNTDQFPRRLTQYISGFICMAIGLVMLKRTNWGVSPITAFPDSVANITPFTLGNTTIMLHVICVIAQIIIIKRVTLKAMLTMFVGVPFGYLVDLLMWLWNPQLGFWQKVLVMILGIIIQALGVALISGCDLMLPAPDSLNKVISLYYHKKLGSVKMGMDAMYVSLAIIINLISTHSLSSIGVASVAAVLLTGRFINVFNRLFPKIKMEEFFPLPDVFKRFPEETHQIPKEALRQDALSRKIHAKPRR